MGEYETSFWTDPLSNAYQYKQPFDQPLLLVHMCIALTCTHYTCGNSGNSGRGARILMIVHLSRRLLLEAGAFIRVRVL